ncbi:hypothetical protein ACTXT7_001903 [Hymenolepis weldensis]
MLSCLALSETLWEFLELQPYIRINCTANGRKCLNMSVYVKAIMIEEERARRRKAQTLHQLFDPVSASRSPNAKVKPPYKMRYTTHNFASPSRESQRNSVSPHRLGYSLELVNLGNRTWTATDFSYSSAYNRNQDSAPRKTKHSIYSPFSLNFFLKSAACLPFNGLHSTLILPTAFDVRSGPSSISVQGNSTGLRPGYTAGQLSLGSSKTSSIPASHCFSSPRLDAPHNGHATNEKTNGHDSMQSQISPIRTNGVLHDEGTANSSRDFDTSLLGSTPSYPSVVFSTPLAVPVKHIEENPIKEIPYKDLLASLGQPPKGVDRTRLEIYLSDAEFQEVFKLSRVAFYRLPEWKRNDLKRRVDLF